MRYLGIDLGSKTIGLAMSDQTCTIASPFKTIFFDNEDYLSTIDEIKQITKEYEIQKIILGLPKNMNNTLGERAQITMQYKKMLEDNLKIPVILFDERLTSVISNSILIEADMSRKKRKKKVDSIAAQIILQDYLNKEKNNNYE
ncbi:MAG: Holliday junction resolvase RuvX [Bacilli bacterium]